MRKGVLWKKRIDSLGRTLNEKLSLTSFYCACKSGEVKRLFDN